MNDFEKIYKELSSKEKFYSSLTSTNISDKEYKNVLNDYNKFEIKKLKDYYELYFKCDVLFLADLFIGIQNGMIQNQN